MELLLKAAVLTLAGCAAGKLTKAMGLSKLFGYLLAGVVLGPELLRVLTRDDLAALALVREVVLAVVAFKVGSELVFRDLGGRGRSFLLISLGEVAGAVVAVFALLNWVLKLDLALSLLLAAAAAGSAPTAALLAVRQYRARGPVTSNLVPVAALDGVLGLLLFGVVLALVRVHQAAQGSGLALGQLVFRSLPGLGGSLLLGAVLGLGLAFLAKRAGDTDELLITSLAVIIIAVGAAHFLNLSSLITNTVLGLLMANVGRGSNRVFLCLNSFTPPIYLLFFSLVGANLRLGGLWPILAAGSGYVLARAAGKMLGSRLGAQMAQTEPTVQKYLGLTLLPQDGITIALTALVHGQLPEYGPIFSAVIVLSVLVFEALGPYLVKLAFNKAGEVGGVGRQSLS